MAQTHGIPPTETCPVPPDWAVTQLTMPLALLSPIELELISSEVDSHARLVGLDYGRIAVCQSSRPRDVLPAEYVRRVIEPAYSQGLIGKGWLQHWQEREESGWLQDDPRVVRYVDEANSTATYFAVANFARKSLFIDEMGGRNPSVIACDLERTLLRSDQRSYIVVERRNALELARRMLKQVCEMYLRDLSNGRVSGQFAWLFGGGILPTEREAREVLQDQTSAMQAVMASLRNSRLLSWGWVDDVIAIKASERAWYIEVNIGV